MHRRNNGYVPVIIRLKSGVMPCLKYGNANEGINKHLTQKGTDLYVEKTNCSANVLKCTSNIQVKKKTVHQAMFR